MLRYGRCCSKCLIVRLIVTTTYYYIKVKYIPGNRERREANTIPMIPQPVNKCVTGFRDRPPDFWSPSLSSPVHNNHHPIPHSFTLSLPFTTYKIT